MTACRGEQPAVALIGLLLAAAGCLADLGECFPSIQSNLGECFASMLDGSLKQLSVLGVLHLC